MTKIIQNKKVLVTGGAGFIGSNLVDRLLEQGNEVVCLDNFATGKRENLAGALKHPAFKLVEGDIRNYEDCQKAVEGCDYVLHQAALGSVPRSIADPMTTTDVNIGGFVKMLHAASDAGVKRFVYAASSSTYGDHPALPKVEHQIGKALSPYAITKYVDELFAENFSEVYGIETIGLRYFNVFGRRQDPNGAYAAVIPLFVKQFIQHQSPRINGDGSYSRDFTYIENVLQANQLAAITPSETIRERTKQYHASIINTTPAQSVSPPHRGGVAPSNDGDGVVVDGDGVVIAEDGVVEQPVTLSQVFNIAYGQRTTLNELAQLLKNNLAQFDPKIGTIDLQYGSTRPGDVPHSLASIEKAHSILGYQPEYSVKQGLEEACEWYWGNTLSPKIKE
ncbi:SDR family oxidoreductase [Sunxiuqinia dokdonensis]|uniref:UDP-glucose 4-epimerase n=1 Tax=Sunxiuqinia dokdonensis TaxID=1409788 RepID=A0A0L8VF66_9BACT|nr:SDR family oxidoreductase [Sunxiuqinia dokdonensis]KOH47101.1 UDP-glucose 4-epimerase [Sunxiuqinia dokdonensis]